MWFWAVGSFLRAFLESSFALRFVLAIWHPPGTIKAPYQYSVKKAALDSTVSYWTKIDKIQYYQ
jgi:hypothetical protein